MLYPHSWQLVYHVHQMPKTNPECTNLDFFFMISLQNFSLWCNSKRNPASHPLLFSSCSSQKKSKQRYFGFVQDWLMASDEKVIEINKINALRIFFCQIMCNCEIEFILISDSHFFPDLYFRIYLWSWRPYMRILWILDKTRNSFWRESFFKQIFVQKCHIKVCWGWIWRQMFVVSKNDCHSMKGYQI